MWYQLDPDATSSSFHVSSKFFLEAVTAPSALWNSFVVALAYQPRFRWDVLRIVYVSSNAMATCVAALPIALEDVSVGF